MSLAAICKHACITFMVHCRNEFGYRWWEIASLPSALIVQLKRSARHLFKKVIALFNILSCSMTVLRLGLACN